MSATPGTGSITVASATAIGVGGMMGAGLYTLLGLASTTAGVWLPVAFLVGGAVTIFSVYSYSNPSAAGPASHRGRLGRGGPGVPPQHRRL